MSISVSSQEGVSSCRSAANYARVFHASWGKSVSRRPFQRRLVGILHVMPTPFVRCATIEEIEAEKFMIDTDAKQRMEKTIETVWANFNSIRTGRSNPAMLDKIKEMSKVVAKQIEEGKIAKTYLMVSKVIIEKRLTSMVALRNVRRDALKAYEKLEKEKKLSKDDVKGLASALQKLRDDYVKKIDCLQAKSEGTSNSTWIFSLEPASLKQRPA